MRPGRRLLRIAEDAWPFTEGKVRGGYLAAILIAGVGQLEEEVGVFYGVG